MPPDNFDDLLLQTFEDHQLSRSEKDLLKQLLAETLPDEQKLAQYRNRAFAAARAALNDPEAQKVLEWLEDVVKVLQNRSAALTSPAPVAEACFSPGDNCPRKIGELFIAARQQVDVCVFTITDNRIAQPLLEAHKRGVKIRIVSDNEKLLEAGSDIERFRQAGIPVRVDKTEYHMHHKFAVFDQSQLLTGSYNWTRGAAEFNHENFIISSDPRLVKEFSQVFEQLWSQMQPLH